VSKPRFTTVGNITNYPRRCFCHRLIQLGYCVTFLFAYSVESGHLHPVSYNIQSILSSLIYIYIQPITLFLLHLSQILTSTASCSDSYSSFCLCLALLSPHLLRLKQDAQTGLLIVATMGANPTAVRALSLATSLPLRSSQA
jgi:hypothetical protein